MSERRFGIFWSDVEVATRVYAAGKRIVMDPQAPFVHDHFRGASSPERGLLLDLDAYVGAVRYFREYGRRGEAFTLKALIALRLLARLLTVEPAAVLRRRQTLAHYARRWRSWVDFLLDRNRLLEDFLRLADAMQVPRPVTLAPSA